MEVQVFSDLHLENWDDFNFEIFKPKTKLLFLAGDIGHIKDNLYKKFMDYVSYNWEYIYVVLGNHEFYNDFDTNYTYEELYDEYENFFLEYPNIVLVTEGYEYKIPENIAKNTYIIGGIGWPTLINDYKDADLEYLCGYHGFDNFYKQHFNDFNFIKKDKDNCIDVKYFNTNSEMSKSLLLESINILRELDDCNKIILLTHFPYGDHSLTSSSKFHNDHFMKKQYFCNSYKNEINKNIIDNCDILIAGHTHYSYDFTKDGKRYISNQMGYSSDRDSCFYEEEIFTL